MRFIPLAVIVSIAGLAAQAPTFRSGVELIEVAVIVRDSNGTFVPDLTREDFQISEQGTPQKITAFDRVAMPVFRAAATAAAPPVAREPARAPTMAVPRRSTCGCSRRSCSASGRPASAGWRASTSRPATTRCAWRDAQRAPAPPASSRPTSTCPRSTRRSRR